MSRAEMLGAELLEAARELAQSRIWQNKCEVCGARTKTGHAQQCAVGRVLRLLKRLEEVSRPAVPVATLPEAVPVLPGDDPRIQVDEQGWYVACGGGHSLRFVDYAGAKEWLNAADEAGAVPR